MEKPFIAKLQNEVVHECDACQTLKTLKYLMMGKSFMLSICEECRDDMLKIGGDLGAGGGSNPAG